MLSFGVSSGRTWAAVVCATVVGCGADRADQSSGAGGAGGAGGGVGVGGASAGGAGAGGSGGCARQVSGGWTFTCAVKGDRTAWCWGDVPDLDGFTESAHPVMLPSLGANVEQLATGWHHACALTKAGVVRCWGSDETGQLGDGDPASATTFASGATAIASRHKHTCAVKADGSAWCWGENNRGQVGDGTKLDRHVPTKVVGIGVAATKVTVGSSHSCAATSDGVVWCWGLNSHWQLGDGTTEDKSIPTPVLALATPAVELTAGHNFTCALEQSGLVWCWGEGAGSTTPKVVQGLGSVAHIGSGWLHICAVTTAGGLRCWGDNFTGQVGDGTTDDQLDPVAVFDSGAVGVAGGHYHTCAVMSDGTLRCWGQNAFSQLADGTDQTQTSPVPVVGLCP